MNISIKTIPHKKQRYPTAADWKFRHGKLAEILVSETKNRKYNSLLALHEFIEAILCEHKGITQREVDDFDKNFEKERAAGLHMGYVEPGNHPKAPYWAEHQFASLVEEMVAKRIGVDWNKYDSFINKL